MESKKVTVGIPVYNAEKYIETNLLSILNQTFPLDAIEIICVNDGSTDQSAEILDRYAKTYEQIKVIHQENSGGPGMPRNRVIDHASGEFIFFVDSDDFLGSEAIERMYNTAKENNTEVVLGKMVGVNGRGVPKSMFKENQPRTDIYQSNIIYTLAPIRLIKTELIRKHNLRFPSVSSGEDQPFMIQVYLLAKGISVVADYNCYYAVKTEGKSASSASIDPGEYYGNIAEVIKAIKRCTPIGKKRYQVLLMFLKRHMQFSRTKSFVKSNWTNEEKIEWFGYAKQFLQDYIPESIEQRLPFYLRLRAYLIRNKDYETYERYFHEEKKAVFYVKNGSVMACFESLEGKDIPDQLLDFTEQHKAKHHLSDLLWDGHSIRASGWFYHELLDNAAQKLTVVFKNRETGEELNKEIQSFDLNETEAKSLPKNAQSNTGFQFEWNMADFINASGLKGPWDLFIDSNIDGYVKRGRLGSNRSAKVRDFFKASYIENGGKISPVTPYYTNKFNNFSIDVGGVKKSPGYMDEVCMKWLKKDVLEITGLYILDFIHPLPQEPGFSFKAENEGKTFLFPLTISRTSGETNVWQFHTKVSLGSKLSKKMSKNPIFTLKLIMNSGGWKQEASHTIKAGA